jgi:hypothetical protein
MARAGSHVRFYPVHTRTPDGLHPVAITNARMYWAHERILIGGSLTEESVATLRELGVTHVLSAESERDDLDWPKDKRARFPFPDDGQHLVGRADLMGAMAWARSVLLDPKNVLYTHCQLGGSRGPTMGYLAMRAGLRMPPEEAMRAIRATREGWMPHARRTSVRSRSSSPSGLHGRSPVEEEKEEGCGERLVGEELPDGGGAGCSRQGSRCARSASTHDRVHGRVGGSLSCGRRSQRLALLRALWGWSVGGCVDEFANHVGHAHRAAALVTPAGSDPLDERVVAVRELEVERLHRAAVFCVRPMCARDTRGMRA